MPPRPRPRRVGGRKRTDSGWVAPRTGWVNLTPAPGWDGHPKGRMWERIKSRVLQDANYKCHACGHFGNPHSGMGIDHDPVPLSECEAAGINPYDPKNLKCIHHRLPCPTCADAAAALGNKWSGYCNALKGSGSTARFRIRAANATGLTIEGVAPSFGKPRREAAARGERSWD